MLQEQFKFVYDTLEEYVVCGTSFFYVQELSERLKAKSLKDKKTKKHPNEYEKEYSVSHSCACFSRKIPPELKKKRGKPRHNTKEIIHASGVALLLLQLPH